MNLKEAAKLTEKHAVCPECGSSKFTSGDGSGMEVTETAFHRWCKCGWSVEEHEEK